MLSPPEEMAKDVEGQQHTVNASLVGDVLLVVLQLLLLLLHESDLVVELVLLHERGLHLLCGALHHGNQLLRLCLLTLQGGGEVGNGSFQLVLSKMNILQPGVHEALGIGLYLGDGGGDVVATAGLGVVVVDHEQAEQEVDESHDAQLYQVVELKLRQVFFQDLYRLVCSTIHFCKSFLVGVDSKHYLVNLLCEVGELIVNVGVSEQRGFHLGSH